jgi:ADP-heptose:LPS heptosyltransferase
MSRRLAVPSKLRLLQTADRLLGPGLCKAMPRRVPGAGAPGRPLSGDAVRHLLLIRPGGLGDAVLCWPLLHVLRDAFPLARIDLLAERRNAGAFQLAADRPDAASASAAGLTVTAAGAASCAEARAMPLRVICYDDEPLGTLRSLREQRYDLVIDTEQYHHFSVLLANLLRPRWLCGFDTLGRRRFHTHSVPHSEDDYEALSFLRLAGSVTGRMPAFDPEQAFLPVGAAARDFARHALRDAAGRTTVAIMPVAGGSYRLWALEHWANVVSELIRSGYFVVLLGGDDAALAAARLTEAASPGAICNLAGGTSVAETAAVLRESRLLVTSDTGVLHLAVGVGTPTVSLFGPGPHRKWAPRGRRHRLVRKGLACSPCTRFGRTPPCPYDVACMGEITVADVLAAVDQALA